MPLFETVPSCHLPGFRRVKHEARDVSIFIQSLRQRDELLYNHSPIFPFSYLNKGQMKLFINEDGFPSEVIPVVQKFDNLPQYSIWAPACSLSRLIETVKMLTPLSTKPVLVTDLTKEEADGMLLFKGWQKIKAGTDVIQNADAIKQLVGRGYSPLRNCLKHVREDLKPVIKPLSLETKNDSLSVFNNWKQTQGKKYFRVTIGRDLRLIEEYADRVDLKNFFSYVYYVNDKPVAANFGCRHYANAEWGIDVTVKADINYKGMSDFAFWHLVAEMNDKGIKKVNDSGCNSPGNKINKLKWFGGKEPEYVSYYNLQYTGKSV